MQVKLVGYPPIDAIQLVACPKCRQLPKQHCVYPTGRKRNVTHDIRIERLFKEFPEAKAAAS